MEREIPAESLLGQNLAFLGVHRASRKPTQLWNRPLHTL